MEIIGYAYETSSKKLVNRQKFLYDE